MMKKATLILLLFIVLLSANAMPVLAADQVQSEVEFGFTYSHSSNNRLVVNGYSFFNAIIIGTLKVDEIKRDVLIPTVTLRHYFDPEVGIELVMPYKYRLDNTYRYADGGVEKKSSETGIGDIEFRLNLKPGTNRPDSSHMFTIGVKMPTGLDPYEAEANTLPLGSGHWGVKASYTRMKQLDPVVLFGGISYFENRSRELETIGIISPGDTWQYTVGLAFAINDRFSVNSRFEQSLTSKTIVNGTPEKASNLNSAVVYLGSNYETDGGHDISFSLGIGLTEDSPDFTIDIGIPFRF